MNAANPPPSSDDYDSRGSSNGDGRRRIRRPGGFRLADVRAGEGRFVLGSSLTLAGIVAAHVSLETARDTLFLAKLGARDLVWVYMIMAVLVAGMGRISASVDRFLGRSNALILTLMVSAVGTALFYVAGSSARLTFFFYLWVGVTGTLLLLQFWLFASARFTVAQGRRLFGLIAAGGVLGAVSGGAVATLLTRVADIRSLLIVAIALHLATALLVTTAPSAATFSASSPNVSFRQLRSALHKNSYVKRIALLNILATATLLLVDYAFKSATSERLGEAELGRFLAIYYMSINAVALGIQVVMSMRVLQRAGTVLTLSILPLTLMVAAGAPLFLGGALIGAIIARGADGALRHSLHRVSAELLYLPLEPKQRTVAKSMMESVVTRGTQGFTALALLFLGTAGLDQPREVLLLVAFGSLLWLIVALSLRRPYLAQFRQMMGRDEGRPRVHLDELSLDSVELVIESLSSPKESEVLGAISLFEEAKRTGLIPALLLYHPNETILLRALELVPSKDRKDWPPLAQRLLDHSSLDVRLAAARALGRYGHAEVLSPGDFKEPELIVTAAFFQADRLENPLTHPTISQLLRAGHDETASRATVAILDAISDHGSRRWAEFLLEFGIVKQPRLGRRLTAAMARVKDPRFVPPLIEMLDARVCTEGVRHAFLAIGLPALHGLIERFNEGGDDDSFQKALVVSIGQFDSQKATDFLLDVLHQNLPGGVRYKALVALCGMLARTKIKIDKNRLLPLVTQNGQQYLTDTLVLRKVTDNINETPPGAQAVGHLLLGLLRDKRKQSVERMTRLLQLLHPRENLRRVYHAITGPDLHAKAAAAELVEVLTLGNDEELREIIRTVMDASGTLGREEHLSELSGFEFLSLSDAVSYLLQSLDPALSAIAAEFARQAELLEVAPLVEEVLERNPWLLAASQRATPSVLPGALLS